MLGSRAIRHWSSTQSSVALSSGEAEVAGVIRGAGRGLGYQALLRDFGVSTSLRVWTDSTAAIGIYNRLGVGRLRHPDTHTHSLDPTGGAPRARGSKTGRWRGQSSRHVHESALGGGAGKVPLDDAVRHVTARRSEHRGVLRGVPTRPGILIQRLSED